QWKRIFHRGDDAPDSRGDDALGARTGASGVRTRFERAVHRRAARPFARFVQRVHLGVRFPGAFMRAIADDDAFVGDDAGADDRIGSRAAEAAARLLERAPHPAQVAALYHFSWNSAST